jgi:hypothetical protein
MATEHESTAEFAPVVTLEEVKVAETHVTLYQHRCLLYRMNKDTKSYVQRGLGDIKIVREISSGTVALAMHMEKTFRPCLNCVVTPDSEMKANETSDRSWEWVTTDFADFDNPGVASVGLFAVKFKTPEIANEFKAAYDRHKVENGPDAIGLHPATASTETAKEPEAAAATTADAPAEEAAAPAEKDPETPAE